MTSNDDTTKPLRLADLDPRAVGRDAAQRAVTLMQRLAFRLAPGVTVDLYAPRYREDQLPAHGAVTEKDLDATQIALTLAGLTIYAQRGCSESQPALDWTDDEMAADAVNEAASDLASDVIGTEAALTEVLLGSDDPPRDPVRLVMTAAWARVTLARGEPLNSAQLGVLAGLHTSRVRALRAAGEIPGWVSDGNGRGATPCPATAARTWLASRGVAGV